MNASVHPRGDLVEHALALIAAAEIEATAKARQLRAELDAWRTLSVEHAAAAEEAQRQWQALGSIAPALKARFTEPVRKPRKSRLRGTLAALALVIGVGSLAFWQLRQPVFDQAAQTGVAQLARVALPDDSRIDVNAQSAVRATYYRDRRMVELLRGEARFEVSNDSARPFRVVTRAGTVEVLGTIFVVADRGDRIVVEVERGRVRVLPPEPATPVELAMGERVAVRGGVAGPIEALGSREPGSWREGWLVFDNERLGDALPAINAFRTAPIVFADERAADLRLTGRFRATDSQGLLDALPKILPVEVEDRPDGAARISAR